jgi:hypothetical protein
MCRRRDGRSTGRPSVEVVLLTLLFLALPSLFVLLLGEKAKKLLPEVRDWMNANSWIVSECVIGLFVVITASSL